MFIDLTSNPASTVVGMPGGLTGLVHDALMKGEQEALGNVGSPTNPSASVYWASILNRALNWSYWHIIEQLMLRGYSKAIIDQWDRGVEFQSDLGVWYCLQWIATQTTQKIEQTSLDAVDRRTELSGKATMRTVGIQGIEPVGVTIGGIWQWPDTNVGQAVTGPMEHLICMNPFSTQVSGEWPFFGDSDWPFPPTTPN